MIDEIPPGAMSFLKIAESLRNLANTAKEQMDNGEPVDALNLLEDATRRIQNPNEDDVLDAKEFE
jgi:hypothetical protein